MYEAMVGNSRVADRPRSGAKQLVETSASDPKRSRRASSISAAEIEPKQIEWLWPGRIPANAITVLAGDPGLGKSLLTIELAARLTRGRLAPKPSSVVMLTAEDSLAHVVRPRLEAANADIERVHFGSIHRDGSRPRSCSPRTSANWAGWFVRRRPSSSLSIR